MSCASLSHEKNSQIFKKLPDAHDIDEGEALERGFDVILGVAQTPAKGVDVEEAFARLPYTPLLLGVQ